MIEVGKSDIKKKLDARRERTARIKAERKRKAYEGTIAHQIEQGHHEAVPVTQKRHYGFSTAGVDPDSEWGKTLNTPPVLRNKK